MRDERLEVSVTFVPAKGYVASAPELKAPVTALSLGGLRRRIEALMMPDDLHVVLQLDRTAIPMLASGEILADVSISMTRILVGFLTGSLVGVVMGVLLGRIRPLHDLLDPIIELLRYLSPTAMIPDCREWNRRAGEPLFRGRKASQRPVTAAQPKTRRRTPQGAA
jgi:hypothetical protein